MTTLHRHPLAGLMVLMALVLPSTVAAQTATFTPTESPTFQTTPPCGAGAVVFGKTTLGVSGAAQYNPSMRASRYPLNIPATVYSLSLYNTSVLSGTQAQVGIYQDNAGSVGTLLVNTAPQSVVNGWNVFGVPPTQLSAGNYWLAYLYSAPGAYSITHDTTAGTSSVAYTASAVTMGNFPASIPAVQYYNNDHDAIYASVCGGDTPTPTETLTRTFTRTSTDTRTPTMTRTPTNTGTVLTATRTLSSTPTNSSTATFSPTSTLSSTPNPSLTPLCGASAGSFGMDSFSGTTTSGQALSNSGLRMCIYALSQSATITTLTLFQGSQDVGAQVRVGIYQDNGAGFPGGLICESQTQIAVFGWNFFKVPDTPLPSGNYWLAYLYDGGANPYWITYDTMPAGTRTLAYANSVPFGPFPPVLPSLSYGDSQHEPIYANFCPGPVDTHTPTSTRTPTPTRTATVTHTPSGTAPDTSTPTDSPTVTLSPTITLTPTITLSPTFTLSPTETSTRTQTATPILTPPCGGAFGTFGKDDLVSTTSGFTGFAGGVRGSVYPLSQGATVYTLSTYQLDGGFPIAAAIYSNQGPDVGSFIVGSAPQTSVVGWNLLPVPPTYLAPGLYWLVFNYNLGVGGSYNAFFGTAPAATRSGFSYSGAVIVGSFPGSFGAISYGNNQHEVIYASFCPQDLDSPTSTPSRTETPTGTPSSTSSATPTTTSSTSRTPTPSNTPTPTLSRTSTASLTPSNSMTATPSLTPSRTATPSATLSPSMTSTPPASTATATASPTTTASATPSLTSSATPTMTSSTSLTPTLSNTPTATPSFSPTPSLTLTPSLTSSPSPTATATFTPTATATSSTSLTPTFSMTFTVTFSRTPTPTLTFTLSPTPTLTSTVTSLPYTQTRTPTTSSTPSLGSTDTPTALPTATQTPVFPTTTPTIQPGSTPILLQNPVTTGTLGVLPPAFVGTFEVTVEIYTTAFRRVAIKKFPSTTSGTVLTVELLDDWGRPLPNGVYYLRVTTPEGPAMTTLVIAR